MSPSFKVSVVGLGKAGLPLAAVISDSGLSVLGVDLDKKRVERINKGENPIPEEPGLSQILKKRGGKTLIATTDGIAAAKECNAHIVIVPLFISDKKIPDFSIMEGAFRTLGKSLKKGDVVVLETTVPPKTTMNRIKPLLEKVSKLKAGVDFFLAYSPERIMTGYSISRFKEFPKLVGGINDSSTRKAVELYSHFAKPIALSSSTTAELAKVAEGLYRDVNIALSNELLLASEHYGVDFWEMRRAATHQFSNIHEPGNVGGHCIPVYPWFIINEMNVPLISKAREINDSMIEFYAGKVDVIVRKKKGAKVLVIGLSYREGVKEKAYTRSIPFISLLKKRGYSVFGYDPLYSKEEVEKEFEVAYVNDSKEFGKMDCVVLLNKETSLKSALFALKEKVVDVKNVLG